MYIYPNTPWTLFPYSLSIQTLKPLLLVSSSCLPVYIDRNSIYLTSLLHQYKPTPNADYCNQALKTELRSPGFGLKTSDQRYRR